MTRITSSNGVDVRTSADGRIETHGAKSSGWSTVQPRLAQALREFFQAEADERLGRWRWPEKDHMLVYADESVLLVVDERDGDSVSLSRKARRPGPPPNRFHAAAAAWLDAHPEPKPWHDAKPGQVWVLSLSESGGGSELPWTVDGDGEFVNPASVTFLKITDSTITAGHRIWPEVSS